MSKGFVFLVDKALAIDKKILIIIILVITYLCEIIRICCLHYDTSLYKTLEFRKEKMSTY